MVVPTPFYSILEAARFIRIPGAALNMSSLSFNEWLKKSWGRKSAEGFGSKNIDFYDTSEQMSIHQPQTLGKMPTSTIIRRHTLAQYTEIGTKISIELPWLLRIEFRGFVAIGACWTGSDRPNVVK